MPSNNPRYANFKARSEVRRWLLATYDGPCGICGLPIDKTLTTYADPRDGKTKRHPMSAEVDEVVPVSRGGSPIDRDNVRLVHRRCNQRRGNRMDGDGSSANLALPHSREW